ncbi:MAG: hypothetical protein IBX69_03805 [Anaerolineales bacterium]|nr:hypothetical protein [Anaerolineales bacterium]
MNPLVVAADVYLPGLILPLLNVYGLFGLFAFLVVLLLLETLVLVLVKWAGFGRALLASLLMNLISTILGVILDLTLWDWQLWWVILIAFAASVIVEGGVLMLMKQTTFRLNIIAAVAANLASYLILILPAYLFVMAL